MPYLGLNCIKKLIQEFSLIVTISNFLNPVSLKPEGHLYYLRHNIFHLKEFI